MYKLGSKFEVTNLVHLHRCNKEGFNLHGIYEIILACIFYDTILPKENLSLYTLFFNLVFFWGNNIRLSSFEILYKMYLCLWKIILKDLVGEEIK